MWGDALNIVFIVLWSITYTVASENIDNPFFSAQLMLIEF